MCKGLLPNIFYDKDSFGTLTTNCSLNVNRLTMTAIPRVQVVVYHW